VDVAPKVRPDTLTGEHTSEREDELKVVLVYAGGVAPKVRPGYPTGEQY
jgi:hypothetical protein